MIYYILLKFINLVLASPKKIWPPHREIPGYGRASDHQIIRFKITCNWVQSKTIKYDYFKANYNGIREYAKNKNLFTYLCDIKDNDVEGMWNNITVGLSKIRKSFY